MEDDFDDFDEEDEDEWEEDLPEEDHRPAIENLQDLYDAILSELFEDKIPDSDVLSLCMVGSDNHCGGDVNYNYILVDVSEIRQNKDGSFKVSDLHGEYEDFSCSGNEVIDFYIGRYSAFESDFNPDTPKSFFNKGFKITMSGLFKLEESNSTKNPQNLN